MSKIPFLFKEATESDPQNLIIVSKPKVGKTSLLVNLPNCLLLDTENGSSYVSGYKEKVTSVADLKAIGEKIKEAGCPFQFIAVDTLTALEPICVDYAEDIYKGTVLGKNWDIEGKKVYGSITNLPKGSGYYYVRQAMNKVLAYIKTLAPYTIFSSHVKETNLLRDGIEITSLDLNLTGTLKHIVTTQSDGIGYVYRHEGKNYISFNTSEEVVCGQRSKHLKDKTILLSEEDSNGNYITYWDDIYLHLRK